MDILKQLDITYNIFIFMQFTPYEQTFQILLNNTFPPINNRIIILLSLNYFFVIVQFFTKFIIIPNSWNISCIIIGLFNVSKQKSSKLTHYLNIDDPLDVTWGTLFVQQWLLQFSPQINLGLFPLSPTFDLPFSLNLNLPLSKAQCMYVFFHYESSLFQFHYPSFSKSVCFSYCVTTRIRHHCELFTQKFDTIT